MLLAVWPKQNLRPLQYTYSVGFSIILGFPDLHMSYDGESARIACDFLRLSVFSYNLLSSLSALKSKLAKNSLSHTHPHTHTHTHTHTVTLMLSAACWHMAASHTKLKPLNFPLVFKNRGGCRSFSLAPSAPRSVVWRRRLNPGQRLSCTQRWQKHQTLGLGCAHRWS